MRRCSPTMKRVLPPPTSRNDSASAGREELDEQHARQEASDVGPECDPAGAAAVRRDGRGGAAQELRHKPVAEHDPGRQPHEENEEQRHQGQHPRARVEKEIRSHDPGDGAAGADGRDGRAGVEQRVEQGRCHPAGQVEHQIPARGRDGPRRCRRRSTAPTC